MTATADNVRVGVTGSVYVGATTATLPTAGNSAVDAALTDLGYVGEDGITESQPMDTNEIKAWQNGDIVRRPQNSHELTYTFALLETSNAVEDLFYGGHATIGTALEVTGDQPSRHAFVIDVLDGTLKRRIVIPNGQITEREDVVYSNTDATMYGVTITCYPDASGNKAYMYRGTAA